MDIIQTAEKEIGTTSDINGTVNPRLLAYCEKLGVSYEPGDDGLWCAMFVGYVLEMCGIRSTRSLGARSYLQWGVVVTVPVPGDVVVLWRDSVNSANGHVAFFDYEDENTVYLLGGNQGTGMVDVEAYPKTRVLGYRRAIITNTNTDMETSENTGQVAGATGAGMPPEGFMNALSLDGQTTITIKKPNFETVPNTRYAMITAVTYQEEKDETDISYTQIVTDEQNVVHADDIACMGIAGNLDLTAAVAYVQAQENGTGQVEVNL